MEYIFKDGLTVNIKTLLTQNFTEIQKNLRSFFYLVASILMIIVLSGCFPLAKVTQPLPITLPTRFSDLPLTVGSQSYPVERGQVVRTLVFEGTVQAGAYQDLYFAEDGRVARLHVRSGDHVVPGDLIAELESEGAELDLAEAEADVQLAELRLQQQMNDIDQAKEDARLNLEMAELTLEQLNGDITVSSTERRIAEHKVAVALAEVQQAELLSVAIAQKELEVAELALARAQFERSRLDLRASITGTVRLGEELQVGLAVRAYVAVARVVDAESLVIESTLAADELEMLHETMPAQIEIASSPGVTLPGMVLTLPQPYGNGNTPSIQIAPDVNDHNLSLREGTNVVVQVEVGSTQDVLMLPNIAIQTVAGRHYVVLRENDQLRDQEITIGVVGDTYTEIVDGLSEGTEVAGP
jgi:RND family efflux transporter MFP subunit